MGPDEKVIRPFERGGAQVSGRDYFDGSWRFVPPFPKPWKPDWDYEPNPIGWNQIVATGLNPHPQSVRSVHRDSMLISRFKDGAD